MTSPDLRSAPSADNKAPNRLISLARPPEEIAHRTHRRPKRSEEVLEASVARAGDRCCAQCPYQLFHGIVASGTGKDYEAHFGAKNRSL